MVFDIETILQVELTGDKLARFKTDWDTVIAGQKVLVNAPLVLRQLQQSASLKEEVAPYERAAPASTDRTYS